MKVAASAPGKIILSGEHSVVYGYPALVAATQKRCHITWRGKSETAFDETFLAQHDSLKSLFQAWKADPSTQELSIRSQIPVGRGMGSSAACSVATAAIWQQIQGKKFSLEEINHQAYQLEVLQHGKPSGVDNTIATQGGFLWFRRETPETSLVQPVSVERKLDTLFLIDSGKPRESTKDMVSVVAEQRSIHPEHYTQLFHELEEAANRWLGWLQGEEGNITELIRTNHKLLQEVGVVSVSTQQLVEQIEKIGGAAKITGAGGVKKGSGYLLVTHPSQRQLQALVTKLGKKLEALQVGATGVALDETTAE